VFATDGSIDSRAKIINGSSYHQNELALSSQPTGYSGPNLPEVCNKIAIVEDLCWILLIIIIALTSKLVLNMNL